jgi:predicted ribosome quality control (RQC) complex YloA/Tae2 family protein
VKSLSFKELDLIAEKVATFSGAVLEDVVFNNDVLLLLLKKNEQKVCFVVDLRPKPYFLVSTDRAPGLKKQIKPIVLFLKAHFLGCTFESVEIKKEFGRLLVLKLSQYREMEIHLFSQARNIILAADKAKISLNKVTELRAMGTFTEDLNPREPGEIFNEWMEEFSQSKGAGKVAKGSSEGEDRQKLFRKKQQGLGDLQKKLLELEASPWMQVAQWLSEQRNLEAPPEYREFINANKSVAWNVENAFAKAKQIKEKIKAVLERQKGLQQELEQFDFTAVSKSVKGTVPHQLAEGTKARTRVINDEIRAFIGKSAEDNLKILRKAKAWHLWLHVKDLPGSHGIIAFDKTVQVPVEVLREVALWVVEQSLTPKQRESWRGVKCDVIYSECRFVTPIRGDKLGRVNYKNEKAITVVV